MTGELSPGQMLDAMVLLDQAVNLLDSPIGPDARRRIFEVLDAPSQTTWASAYSVLIAPPMRTLWQAVLRHSDYAVQSKPVYPAPWPVVPTQEQLYAALVAELGG